MAVGLITLKQISHERSWPGAFWLAYEVFCAIFQRRSCRRNSMEKLRMLLLLAQEPLTPKAHPGEAALTDRTVPSVKYCILGPSEPAFHQCCWECTSQDSARTGGAGFARDECPVHRSLVIGLYQLLQTLVTAKLISFYRHLLLRNTGMIPFGVLVRGWPRGHAGISRLASPVHGGVAMCMVLTMRQCFSCIAWCF